MRIFEKHMATLCVTTMLASVSGAASAQVVGGASEPVATSAAGVENAAESMGDVVVTARKRSETLVDSPVAITALSSQDLEQRNIRSLSDLQAFTPGFRMMESGSGGATRGFNVFTARGIYPGGDSPDRQVVSIFVDGIAVGGGGAIPGLTDIAQVEVVNGPQSAYFGRATFAGAVNLITRTPSLTDFSGSVEGSTWTDDGHELRGQIEAPLVRDVLSVRVSGRDWKQGAQYRSFGYGNALGERTTRSGALTVYFTPTPSLRVKLFGTGWIDKDGPPAQGLLLSGDYNCNARADGTGSANYVCGGIGGIPRQNIAQAPTPADVLTTLRNANTVLGANFIDYQGLRRKAFFSSVSADYDLPMGLTLSANGSVGQNHWTNVIDLANRYAPGKFSTFIVPWKLNNSSAEARIASDSSKNFSFLLGANYYHQDATNSSNGDRDFVFRPGAAPVLSRTNTLGVFGSVSYTAFDKLMISLEGRYQSDHVSSQSLSAGSPQVGGVTNSFTPRAIVQYKFTPDFNVYASYSEGTRPAQYNANVYALPAAAYAQVQAQANVPLQVPEERLRMEEVGVKGSLFDRKLTLLLAAYYGDWRDRQIQQTLTYLNPGVTSIFVVLPSGHVRVYGIEAQATARPTRGLTLSGTFAYAETEIINTFCSECASITGVVNPVGNRLPRYPAITGTASVAYEGQVFLGLTGYARTDLVYTGRQYATEANVAWLKASTRVNFRIGVRDGGKFVEVFGQNAFDDQTPVSISRNSDTYLATSTISLAAAPRATFGVRIGSDF